MSASIDQSRLSDGPWRVRVVAVTGSTNADLTAAVREGTAGPGDVLVAETQTAGRGRHGRNWETPAGTALTFSFVVDLTVAPAPGWLPLVTGLGVVDGLRRVGAPGGPRLKWPNDVLAADGRKLVGILAELVTPGVAVVGVGINVNQEQGDLPVDTATSLAVAGGAPQDRTAVLVAVLGGLSVRLRQWTEDPSAAADDYRAACATIGRRVRVELPGDALLLGEAVDVDAEGRIVVAGEAGRRAVAAGDVTHLRAV